jgi:hypothetical protein
MTNSALTNILLLVITVLLLVLVIQNTMNHPSNYQRPNLSSKGSYYQKDESPSKPAKADLKSKSVPMGQTMIFAAMSSFPKGCEGKKTLAECSSPAANNVKAKVQAYAQKGKGIREIFDYVVATWGEEALTAQAIQIRKMRRKK